MNVVVIRYSCSGIEMRLEVEQVVSCGFISIPQLLKVDSNYFTTMLDNATENSTYQCILNIDIDLGIITVQSRVSYL
jgi:hypothetical protein